MMPEAQTGRDTNTTLLVEEYKEKKAIMRHSLVLLQSHFLTFMVVLGGALSYVLLGELSFTVSMFICLWTLFLGAVGLVVAYAGRTYVTKVELRLEELSTLLRLRYERCCVFTYGVYALTILFLSVIVGWGFVLVAHFTAG